MKFYLLMREKASINLVALRIYWRQPAVPTCQLTTIYQEKTRNKCIFFKPLSFIKGCGCGYIKVTPQSKFPT